MAIEIVESKTAADVMALWRRYFDLMEKMTPEERQAFALTMRHLASPMMFCKPDEVEMAEALRRGDLKPGQVTMVKLRG